MAEPAERPQNPYEASSERMRDEDRARDRAFATAPLSSFLLRQLLWALVGGVLGYLLGSWVWALVMFLGWGLAAMPVRWWLRRKYVSGHTEPPRQP
jgi:hypothetical protein